jgi:hypothetical protein
MSKSVFITGAARGLDTVIVKPGAAYFRWELRYSVGDIPVQRL